MFIVDRTDVTLAHILQFSCGSSRIPASGFEEVPKISFTDEDRLPSVSACDVGIVFPRSWGLLDEESFKTKMDLCILGSMGFGVI